VTVGEPLVLTQSTVKDYQRCKRRWWLRYVRRLARPAEYNSPSDVGNMVHDALAEWYAGRLEDPAAHVREFAEAMAALHPDHAEEIYKDEDLASIMVEGYLADLEETGKDYQLAAVEPEREAEVVLAPADEGVLWRAEITLRAKMDGLVVMRDKWKAILEHKTVGNFTDLPAIARMDRQLLTYELILLLEEIAKGVKNPKVVGAVLNMLRKVKRTARANPPFYERVEVQHNREQLRSHWKHFVGIGREMQELEARLEDGEDHHSLVPPNPTTTCRWDCQFFTVCPLFDDGSDVEYVLAEEFEESDPLERYQLLEKR
jgi:hypothetical protein